MEFVLKHLKERFSITEIANIHFFEFQKEFATNNDKHPFSELVFVSGGTLHIASEDYTGKLRKGEMIIHPENTLHSLSCGKKSSPKVIIIGFKCNDIALKSFSDHPTRLSDRNVEILSKIIKEGRNVFMPPYDVPVYDMKKKENQPYGAEQMLKILLESLIIGIIREYSYKEPTKPDSTISFSTSEIIDYIDQNYLEKITIDELAFLFSTNRTSLCRAFKEATGKTLIQYIGDKKLTFAKEALTDTGKSLSAISDDMHFPSLSHFSRFFSQKTGMSPNAYRAENQHKTNDIADCKMQKF